MSRLSEATFRRIRVAEEIVALLNSISVGEVESKLRNKKYLVRCKYAKII